MPAESLNPSRKDFPGPASGRSGRSVPLAALDFTERMLIVVLYGWFLWRMLWVSTLEISSVLLVIAEALPLAFVLFRKPTEKLSRNPADWVLALLGTTMPLFVRPAAQEVGSVVAAYSAYGMILFGLFVQIAAKLVLGTRFGIVAANRGVCALGPYRFVRHPMYAGYTLTHIGFLIAMPDATNAAIYVAALILQLARIDREERILMQDPRYEVFAGRVGYRLLPGVY